MSLNDTQLFNQGIPPMPFKPKRGNKMEEQIAKIAQIRNFISPICQIKANLYLIGCNRVNLDFKYNQVLVHVGGGTQKLEDYMYRNENQMKSTLIDYMVRSGRDLPWVVEQLKLGNKINQKENFQKTLEM